MHRWCLHGPINSYYSFWWNNLILCLYNIDTLNICMKESGWKKKLTKLQLWELRQLFPYMAFVNAWIVPLWADQLLPQLLMEQFDTLPIQCRHIEHMHEGVYNFFWSDSTEIFFSKPKFFHWLLLCGVSNKHAYWLFSFLQHLQLWKCLLREGQVYTGNPIFTRWDDTASILMMRIR